jgi:mono/diheme cytochrome c family protein
MTRASLVAALATLLAGCAAQSGAGEAAGPPALAVADTAAGNQLFHGTGDCNDCHGDGGVGTPDGPSLVSGTWDLGDGSYEWLLQMTRHAGWGMRGRGGDPQPMRGPTVLDSVQVSQVARYVWAISRDRRPRG